MIEWIINCVAAEPDPRQAYPSVSPEKLEGAWKHTPRIKGAPGPKPQVHQIQMILESTLSIREANAWNQIID